MSEMRGILAPGNRRNYVLAGDATVTIRSTTTGNRYTFKVQKCESTRPGEWPIWFVRVLNGSDNTGDYMYLGTIFPDGFRLTRKSSAGADAPSVIAFTWLSRHWEDARVEVWHEGVCGRCGRKLTVPESIETGLGPVCAGKAA